MVVNTHTIVYYVVIKIGYINKISYESNRINGR